MMRMKCYPHDRIEKAIDNDDPNLAMKEIIHNGIEPKKYMKQACYNNSYKTLDALLDITPLAYDELNNEAKKALEQNNYYVYETLITYCPDIVKKPLYHLPLSLQKEDKRFTEIILEYSTEISQLSLLYLCSRNEFEFLNSVFKNNQSIRNYETMWRDTMLETLIENNAFESINILHSYPSYQPQNFTLKLKKI